jgi:hypothetical protein
MRGSIRIIVLAVMLLPGLAQASVTYSFWGLFVSSRDTGGQVRTHGTIIMELRHPSPILQDGLHTAQMCITMEPGFSCESAHWFAPSGNVPGIPDHRDPVSVLAITLTDGASGTVWAQSYVFRHGAFHTEGMQESLPPPSAQTMLAMTKSGDSSWYAMLTVSGLGSTGGPSPVQVAAPAGVLPLALAVLGLVRLRRHRRA